MPGYTPPNYNTPYMEPEFADHFNAWKAKPSPATSGALLRKVDPIIDEAMRTYGSSSATSPTLKSKAKKMTLHAMTSYDPMRAKLRTHLLSQLQGIRRLAAREDQLLHVPEQVLLEAGEMRNAESQLRDTLGRDPSDMELADHTSISRKRLGYLRNLKPTMSEGRLVRVNDEGTGLSAPAIQSDMKQSTLNSWHDFVYHDLDPVDQVIMEHTLGMHSKRQLSNQEIARKLRLSPGAVSQRKSRIQQKIDQYDLTGLM